MSNVIWMDKVESLKKAGQFIVDNAEKLVNDHKDAMKLTVTFKVEPNNTVTVSVCSQRNQIYHDEWWLTK